jgi:hypothetical protein
MDGSSNINEIIINDNNKFDYFRDKIKSLNFSKKSSYKLVVVTCYFNGSSIQKLITDVDTILKDVEIDLDEVELFLDKRELYVEYRLNPSNFKNDLKRITLKIPKSSQLFHPKAYCLMPVNDDINIEVAESGLFFGSANLSEKGFGAVKSSPNLELMYFTVDGTIISDFYRSLRRIETYEFKSLEDFAKMIEEESTSEKEKNSLYKWRLIKEGNFVYSGKPGTIEKNLAINYKYQKDNDQDIFKTRYYFYDNSSLQNNSENSVGDFKQSNEYREILDIFLRYNSTYEVDWGNHGIKILGNYYWLPKTLTNYLKETLTDYLKAEFLILKDEIKNLFYNNKFFKTDLDSSAVKKMAGDLEANWSKLTTTWKEKVFKDISEEDKERLNIQFSKDLDECDKRQIAQILLTKIRTKFLNNLSKIYKRYKLDDDDDIDLIQKIRPNNESENTALIDYVYEQVTKTKAKKNTRLNKHIIKAVNSSTLKLEYIQLPHINRIDFLTDEQLGRLIEAHIRYWLRPWLTQEKQPIKNEGKSIEIEIIQESKVFKLKILIPSKDKVVGMDQFKEEKENWKNLIFIFSSDEDNGFRQMKVYQESNSVSEKVVPIPIIDEMMFLCKIRQILESNLPKQQPLSGSVL